MAGMLQIARKAGLGVGLLLLGGCGQQEGAPANQIATQAARPAVAPARAFSTEMKTDSFEFNFAWPAEAAAIPVLDRRLRAEMDKAKFELVGGAEEEKARRDKEGIDFHPYMSSTVYETAGQSLRLLSSPKAGAMRSTRRARRSAGSRSAAAACSTTVPVSTTLRSYPPIPTKTAGSTGCCWSPRPMSPVPGSRVPMRLNWTSRPT
jgi:hypothetical protein